MLFWTKRGGVPNGRENKRKALKYSHKILLWCRRCRAFVLFTNVEAFYWMTCLTDVCGFTPVVAGIINTIYSIVDSCTSWIQGAIINSTKAGKHGRYRSWLLVLPWIVPFLYAFEFLRVSENTTISAIVILVASISSHFLWNIPYVANVSLVSVVGRTSEGKAVMSSSPLLLEQCWRYFVFLYGPAFCHVIGGICWRKI